MAQAADSEHSRPAFELVTCAPDCPPLGESWAGHGQGHGVIRRGASAGEWVGNQAILGRRSDSFTLELSFFNLFKDI